MQSQISENALFQQPEELIRRKFYLPIEAITSKGNGNWDLCATSLAEPSPGKAHLYGAYLWTGILIGYLNQILTSHRHEPRLALYGSCHKKYGEEEKTSDRDRVYLIVEYPRLGPMGLLI